jgi:ferrochelatase
MMDDPHLYFEKKAIVLFNLGGPQSLKEVKPFLFNLFYDKNILQIPNPFRYLLAKLISTTREKKSKEIYMQMDGRSPIVDTSLSQGDMLQQQLSAKKHKIDGKNIEYRVFVAMRYTAPIAEDVMQAVREYHPDEVILLPLYPHYSCTTTGSFFEEWQRVANKYIHKYATKYISSYATHPNFILAHVEMIKMAIEFTKQQHGDAATRIIFSAHSLPQKIINNGDPYQKETESSVAAIMKQVTGFDFSIAYQSKVGPLPWLKPSIASELQRAANDKIGVIVVPISFTSDHSETLVELDIEYKEFSQEIGVPFYYRIKALNLSNNYIKCLGDLILS